MYWTWNENTGEVAYCEKCYKTLRKCDICKQPRVNHLYDGEKYICDSCQSSVPKCVGCKKYFTGNIWGTYGDSGIFCDKCKKNGDICDICSVIIPPGQGVSLEKKRKICLKCKDTSITDPIEADNIYKEVVSFMEHRFKMILREPVPIKMVNRAEMTKAASESIKGAGRLFGLYIRKNKKSSIYFLFGTPRHITQSTLAHEFTHAWQQENAVKNQSGRIVEGFAEWLAYKMILENNAKEAAKIVENRQDDVYGAGLKLFMRMEEKSNEASVILFATNYNGN